MLHPVVQEEITEMQGKSPTLEKILSHHYSLDVGQFSIEGVEAGRCGYGYRLISEGVPVYYLKFDKLEVEFDAYERQKRDFLVEFRDYIHGEHTAGRLGIDSTVLLGMKDGAHWKHIQEGVFKGTIMTLEPFVSSHIELAMSPLTKNEPDRWSSYDVETVAEGARAHVAFIRAAQAYESKKSSFPTSSAVESFADRREKFLSAANRSNIEVSNFLDALDNFETQHQFVQEKPKVLVHGDFHFGNLLKNEKGVYLPIDLGFMTYGTIIHEIMYYALFDIVRGCMRAGKTTDDEILSNPSLKVILRIYDQAFHLSEADLDALKYIRLATWLCHARMSSFCKSPENYSGQLDSWAQDLRDGIQIEGRVWPDLKPLLREIRYENSRHGYAGLYNPSKPSLMDIVSVKHEISGLFQSSGALQSPCL